MSQTPQMQQDKMLWTLCSGTILSRCRAKWHMGHNHQQCSREVPYRGATYIFFHLLFSKMHFSNRQVAKVWAKFYALKIWTIHAATQSFAVLEHPVGQPGSWKGSGILGSQQSYFTPGVFTSIKTGVLPGMGVFTYNPSILGGWDRRIPSSAQPGQLSKILSRCKKFLDRLGCNSVCNPQYSNWSIK